MEATLCADVTEHAHTMESDVGHAVTLGELPELERIYNIMCAGHPTSVGKKASAKDREALVVPQSSLTYGAQAIGNWVGRSSYCQCFQCTSDANCTESTLSIRLAVFAGEIMFEPFAIAMMKVVYKFGTRLFYHISCCHGTVISSSCFGDAFVAGSRQVRRIPIAWREVL